MIVNLLTQYQFEIWNTTATVAVFIFMEITFLTFFFFLQTSTVNCKERKNMQSTEEFWSRKQFSEAPNNIENWLMARQRIGKPYILAVSSFFPFFLQKLTFLVYYVWNLPNNN